MNNNFKSFTKNFSYALFSNLISIIISILVVLIIPKLIGIKQYGYWQLYIFYSSYVGFLHFGWLDGIYLRYGGFEYKRLDKTLFYSQTISFIFIQICISIIIWSISFLFIIDINKVFIIKMTALCLVLSNVKTFYLYILQATNRIKEYAEITLIGRISYICLIFIFLLFNIKDYKMMILADLIGRVASMLLSIYFCRDLVFNKLSNFKFPFKEIVCNVSVGIKLMFANIASMLIIGVVRFGIEKNWDVSVFGKISLTLSVSNFLMIFINAVGIIMFPVLRRTDEIKVKELYSILRNLLMVVLFGLLIFYYPFKNILSTWLPKYSDSLKYMALIFPMCVYEGKMALLINTYLKTLRKEKLMLRINIISLLLSIVFTFITTQILNNLNLAVLSIVCLLSFRCILAELYLSNILNINLINDILLELFLTCIFITSGWILNSWSTTVVYSFFYIFYLILKRKGIKNSIINLKYYAN